MTWQNKIYESLTEDGTKKARQKISAAYRSVKMTRAKKKAQVDIARAKQRGNRPSTVRRPNAVDTGDYGLHGGEREAWQSGDWSARR